jgi:NADH dehydrogenase
MQVQNVTVFGGSGFLGRYLVQRLAQAGARVKVAVRDPEAARFLKPMGGVGQVVPVAANIRDRPSIGRAVEGADAVVNLVGILYERGRQRFDGVHVRGAQQVAAAAREAGARRFLQVSAIGAATDSPARYGRSKRAGELAVAEAFPGATVVRPSVVFGPEDQFFNRFAALARLAPALPLPGGGLTRFQPVYVGDLAEAMMRLLADEATAGATYELGGPRVYTLRQIYEYVLAETGRRRLLLPLPFALMRWQAMVLQFLPEPPLTPDQVNLLTVDNVVAEGAKGFAELGIQPTAVEAVVPGYLARYRRRGRPPVPPE